MAKDWAEECAWRWYEHGKVHALEHDGWVRDIEAAIRETLGKAVELIQEREKQWAIIVDCNQPGRDKALEARNEARNIVVMLQVLGAKQSP